MNKNNNNIQTEFAQAAGMLASRFSLSPIAGQIYGLLYMSPRPVSLNEMVKKLDISKGSASTNVRTLESWGAVKKVWVDNSRKDYYSPNIDALSVVARRIKEGIFRRMEELKRETAGMEKKIKEEESSRNMDFYSKRIDKVKDMQQKIRDLIELLPDEIK